MRRLSSFLLVICLGFLLSAPVYSLTVGGVSIPDQYQIGKTTLVLNGAGSRRKFIFVRIYVGALYVEKKTHNPQEVLKQPIKVVRMHFTYSHIPANKIRNAFKEDLERISANLLKTEAAKEFLNIFTFPVKEGDNVDLIFYHDTLIVMLNQKKVGQVKSGKLVNAVLSIYIGKHPASESLKKALLGE